AIRAHGRHVELGLEIERRFAPVYANARVLIGSKSLAGENFVDLDPGAPPAKPLPAGATLPVSRAPESTPLDQVIGVLKHRRVRDLRRLVQALGAGGGVAGGASGARRGGRERTSCSRRADSMLAELQRFTPVVQAFLRPLGENLRQLNPVLAYMRPYGRDVAVAPALIGATAKAED